MTNHELLNGRHTPGSNGKPASSIAIPELGRPPRVLVLSAAVGTGHMRAAEAVAEACRQMLPDATVRNVDVLSLSTTPFRRCYGGMYLDLIDVAPQVLGFFYNLMDQPKPLKRSYWEKLRIALEKMSMRPFLQLLTSEPWDVVIHTHFLPAEILASLRQQNKVSVPHTMVITDYETHRMWIHQPCEHFFTATEEAARYLQCFDVPRHAVSATGIPIHPVFSVPKDRNDCLRRHNLGGDRPILLVLTGGYGVGPIADLYKAVLDVEIPMEVIFVAGRNTQAKAQLETLTPPLHHRVHILGYTKEIDELMAVADLVVSKPGGLTTAESLARGVPLAIVSPVPGQEERNSDYLLENGAAIKINHLPTLAYKVGGVLNDPERLAELKRRARQLARPRAAFDVVARSLAFIQPAQNLNGAVASGAAH